MSWYVITPDWKVLASFENLDQAWKAVELLSRKGIFTVVSDKEVKERKMEKLKPVESI